MKNNEQIYGRNDMVMLDQHNKIYGSLGIAENYVLKTVEGTNLTFTSPKNGEFDDVVTEFSLYGKSTQRTTEGKQLFDVGDIDDTKCIAVVEDSLYTVDPLYVLSNIIPVSQGQSIVKGNTGAKMCMFLDENEEGKIEWKRSYDDSLEIVVPEGASYFVFNILKANLNNGIMCNVGVALSKYEPYTGGKPSPNPDYPQEIENIGDKGTIEVKIAGKNLFNAEFAYDKNNYNPPPGGGLQYYYMPFYVGRGNDVTISCESDLEPGLGGYIYVSDIGGSSSSGYVWLYHSGIASLINKQFTLKSRGDYIYLSCAGEFIEVLKAMKNMQIEVSGSKTSYEPYKQPQSLTIETPNGLPGIPVSSGGNYTDESGQQWICDEIDLARGKYVQRVWKGVFDGSEGWAGRNDGRFEVVCLPFNLSLREGLCNQLLVTQKYIPPDNSVWIGSNSNKIYINGTAFWDDSMSDYGVSKWKKHLSSAPLILMTYLDILVETDLTQEQIALYKALHTNKPTTVISNDEQAHMKVTYKSTESV